MLRFAHLCGLCFVAATLLATGASHLAGLRGFTGLLRQHGLLPGGLAAPLAVLVTGAELTVGVAAVAALGGASPLLSTASFAAAFGLGGAFVVYLRRLLAAGHNGSCGCSPLASPLTAASVVPAGSLIAVGAGGLLARLSDAAEVLPPQPWSSLAVGWGLTLAILVLLLPATSPGRVAGARP